MKMICLLRCDYVCDKDIFFLRCDHVHDEDDLFVKYDYINGEYDLLLRCYCVLLCPIQDFKILPAYRLARK